MRHTIATFARLRWRLLRGSIRRGGAEQFGAIASSIFSGIVGLAIGAFLLRFGRSSMEFRELAIAACTLILLALIGFGIVAGVTQPIDPRVVAAEPLSDRRRAVGVLAAAAFGPPGLAAIAIGVGLAGGMVRGWASVPIVVAATLAWLASLLLIARTATNLLGLLLSRFPRTGQLTVGLSGLAFYGVFQLTPIVLGDLDAAGRRDVADAMRWTPPGQIGAALGSAGDDVGRSLLHLALGSIWLPVLAIAFVWSTSRLAVATKREDDKRSEAGRSLAGRALRRMCGTGASGAIAWRSILTRFRTPRTALESITGAGVGLAAVLVPTLTRDDPGSGAVLVGGAVQLAVLFMSGNSFGVDGPALSSELLSGADGRDLVRGKARSIAIVASPLAILGPLLAASLTGEWRYLAAGFGVGIGGLLAGAGAAIVQSALVPIAIPESDNPFAGGETGKGLLAALLLAGVLAALAVATVPVALGLFWATDRGAVALVTIFAAITVIVGWALLRLGVVIATRHVGGREPEFMAAVTPAR